MSDSTSIDDLPMSSQNNHLGNFGGGGGGVGGIGGGGGNTFTYSPNMDSLPGQSQQQIPSNIMNEVMHGVQKASANGMTMIPSRDIPMNPNAFTHDDQIKPNYIPQPPPNERDYIRDYSSMEGIIRDNKRTENQLETLESIYIDLQIPILLGVLYFIFQMPVFRAQLLHFIPSMFGADGNFNIMGLTGTSVIFATCYFVIMKIFNKLGEGLRSY
jgi:hypothetical protein